MNFVELEYTEVGYPKLKEYKSGLLIIDEYGSFCYSLNVNRRNNTKIIFGYRYNIYKSIFAKNVKNLARAIIIG